MMNITERIQSHFQLTNTPFADTVNPQFFYQTEAAEKAFFRMEHCIESGRALGLVWGQSGTGKTLISQLLLEHLDSEKYLPVLALATPKMSKTDVLKEILTELEVEEIPRFSFPMINAVHERILKEERQGRRVVILFDEAHFLSSDALHLLRTLSNLETPEQKLVTVILFAETTFVQRIQHPAYASLRGRIAYRTRLDPLTVEETEQYIKFRLLVAGGTGAVFHQDCYPILHEVSGGIARNINRIAENALLETYLTGLPAVTPSVLQSAVARDSWSQEPYEPQVEKPKQEIEQVLQYGS